MGYIASDSVIEADSDYQREVKRTHRCSARPRATTHARRHKHLHPSAATESRQVLDLGLHATHSWRTGVRGSRHAISATVRLV